MTSTRKLGNDGVSKLGLLGRYGGREECSHAPPLRSPRPNSQWSNHHNQGTSYFPPTASSTTLPTSQRLSATKTVQSTVATSAIRRSDARSASHASSSHNRCYRRGILSEDEDELNNDADGSMQNTSTIEDGDEDSQPTISRHLCSLPHDAEDPLALREGQSAHPVSHLELLPFPQSPTTNRITEVALYSPPPRGSRARPLPANLLWTLLFGWWLAVASFVPTSGRDRYLEEGGDGAMANSSRYRNIE